MSKDTLKWVYLGVLSLVWGSSFILIKKSLLGLTPLQLGSLRILFAAVFLLLIGLPSLKTIKKKEWKWIAISAFVGTFIPVFLFAYAQTEIDSAITSILNSTTPLLTLILGALLFSINFTRNQLIGIIIGLLGCCALIWIGSNVNPSQNYWFAGLVILASVCYAANVNIIKRYMQDINATAIAVGNFIFLIIPAIIVLIASGFFATETLQDPKVQTSLWYVGILAVVGTGTAKVLFNKLVQISNPIFASSVTYTIPVVAFTWGILDGEDFTLLQFLSAGVIILGVFISNRK
ncbi:DMT family transporter [Aquimarina sp. ERC-38]|uniref:DMT family transporter n=1 Tax=Aquimarina sp. ERC-38 TaxID=2949996 RepID=UPI002247F5D2|nr:DMT family transporter [Aquimarina sp. ERC-38]UZO81689.1 DMT family transporter [Aquimarina sp. ERC-38]